MDITSGRLAYWYFRLNGFLSIENFIVHRGLNMDEHFTDIDFLGVRFCHRKELFDQRANTFLEDDNESNLFKYNAKDRIYIVFTEIKRGACSINRSWINNPELFPNLLNAIGIIKPSKISKIAKDLQLKGYVNINRYFISFASVGSYNNPELIPYEKIPIITWDEIISFIYKRVQENKRLKINMQEWGVNSDGINLFSLARNSEKYIEFKNQINIL